MQFVGNCGECNKGLLYSQPHRGSLCVEVRIPELTIQFEQVLPYIGAGLIRIGARITLLGDKLYAQKWLRKIVCGWQHKNKCRPTPSLDVRREQIFLV